MINIERVVDLLVEDQGFDNILNRLESLWVQMRKYKGQDPRVPQWAEDVHGVLISLTRNRMQQRSAVRY